MSIFDSSYTLRADESGDITRYFVIFTDGQAVRREQEVSLSIYEDFENAAKHERRLIRWGERYLEYSELSEEALARRALRPAKTVEEEVFERERDKRLRQAIDELPEPQRRRFKLYHDEGRTFDEIAESEGCKRQPVTRSIKRAEEKIRVATKFYKN